MAWWKKITEKISVEIICLSHRTVRDDGVRELKFCVVHLFLRECPRVRVIFCIYSCLKIFAIGYTCSLWFLSSVSLRKSATLTQPQIKRISAMDYLCTYLRLTKPRPEIFREYGYCGVNHAFCDAEDVQSEVRHGSCDATSHTQLAIRIGTYIESMPIPCMHDSWKLMSAQEWYLSSSGMFPSLLQSPVLILLEGKLNIRPLLRFASYFYTRC